MAEERRRIVGVVCPGERRPVYADPAPVASLEPPNISILAQHTVPCGQNAFTCLSSGLECLDLDL